MARAMNSGESSNNRMKAFACLRTLAGTISAVRSSPKRKIGRRSLRRGLGARVCVAPLPLLLPVFSATLRHEPARLIVEPLGKPFGILVAHACDDAKSF